MKKYILITLFCALSLISNADNDFDCYNIKRAQELIQEQKYADAAQYLDKELESNPTNGFAWMNYALAYGGSELYDEALKCINKAITLLSQDFKDEYISYVTGIKAGIYYGMEDWTKSIETYSQAIKLDKNSSKAYYWRARCYYNLSDWKNCTNDCQRVIQFDDEYKIPAINLLGDICFAQKDYDKAIPYYDKVIDGINNEAALGKAYAYRAASKWKTNNKRGAIDDILQSIELGDQVGYAFLQYFSSDNEYFPLIRTKLQAKIVKSDNPSLWKVALGDCYASISDNVDAIKNYVSAAKDGGLDINFINNRIYSSLVKACAFDDIKYFYNKRLQASNDQVSVKLDYAYHVLDPAKHPDEAIRLLDECITEEPDNGFIYYARARIKSYNNMVREAIEDYSMAIMLNEDYTFSYNERADCYKRIGQTNKANDDYRTVLALDTDDSESEINNSIYALFYLGKTGDAKKKLISKTGNEDFSDYYDAACLWSLMGENNNAISFLQKAFEDGYRDFNHINRDDDLDNIRNSSSFKSLVAKYKQVYQGELVEIHEALKDYPYNNESLSGATLGQHLSDGEQNSSFGTPLYTSPQKVTVSFTVENGVNKVKCKVNDLPLFFIFDTGASKVTISSIEATFMYKNGYLTQNDFGSSEYFSTASGEVVEGTVVNLRTVDIGGVKLNNVKATVVHNQNAPLLLGQSVLSRLGKIEIDNVNKLLIIHPK